MRKFIYIGFVTTALSTFVLPAFAERPGVFDKTYAVEQRRIERIIDGVCSGNVAKRQACVMRQAGAIREQSTGLRGTERYCEAHYGPMTAAALQVKAKEILQLRNQARHRRTMRAAVDNRGEVFVDDLENEYRWIHDELLRRGVRTGLTIGGAHIPEGEVCTQFDCGKDEPTSVDRLRQLLR